jgi:hypothetical protein
MTATATSGQVQAMVRMADSLIGKLDRGAGVAACKQIAQSTASYLATFPTVLRSAGL